MSKQVGMSRNISLDYLNKTIEFMEIEDDFEKVRENLREYIGLYIDDKIGRASCRERV